MLNRFKKTKTACSTDDARFLLLLCLGREPYVAAELETYTDQSFYGALKRVLKSAAFSHSLFDPFVLGKKPMQAVFSAEQNAIIQKGLLQHFKLKLRVNAGDPWLKTLAATLKTDRMQKAFLSVQDVDRLQYLQSQLELCTGEPMPHVFGAVHQSSGKAIRGFAAMANYKTPLVIDFFIDGQPAGSTTADQINREISEKYQTDENVAFSHTLKTDNAAGLTDACLLVFERETGAMICPPKNLVLSVGAAAQTTARIQRDLNNLRTALEVGDTPQLSEQLASLAKRLPSIEQYASMRLADYSLYREIYCTPRPQGMDDLKLSILVTVTDSDDVDTCERTRRSLDRQSYRCFSIAEENRSTDVSGFDLLVRLNAGDELNEHALGWFAVTANANPEAVIIRAGHDHYASTQHNGTQDIEIRYKDPVFISEFDPLILKQRCGYARSFAARITSVKSEDLWEKPQNLWLNIFHQHGSAAFVATGEILLSLRPDNIDEAAEPLKLPPPDTGKKLAIIIPTKDKLEVLKPCVESLLKTIAAKETTEIIIVDNGSKDATTVDWLSQIEQRQNSPVIRIENYDAPFNWADINNTAVKSSDAEYFLFLNNDTLAIDGGWDLVLRQLLAMENAGVIGARLLYGDNTIQHAGVVLNSNSLAIHEGAGLPANAGGYDGRLSVTRQCEAVTGAFLACSKATFHTANGFDAENFPVTFNDIDFCFKVSEAGQQVIYSPMITFYHLESISRGYDGATAEKAKRAKAEHNKLRSKWAARIIEDRWYPSRLSAAGNQGDIMIKAPGPNRRQDPK